jgi:peptidoglycan/LPS O-acetylase OafA/YrhL
VWCDRARSVLTWLTALGMAFVYLTWPIRESNVLGVTVMAFGTAVLLLTAHERLDGSTIQRRARTSAAFEELGRLSYELYLFHLVVLGLLRTMFPPSGVAGNGKLALLVGYLLLSACLAASIAHLFSEPSRRIIRKWLRQTKVSFESECYERKQANVDHPKCWID